MTTQLEDMSDDAKQLWLAVLKTLSFNPEGLIPAIAQQYNSGKVLMMAWMNRESIKETLSTGRVCYWSRSRSKLWRKGESSGQIQFLIEMRIDCDGDTLLLQVDQTGPACHTGQHSCFYRALRDKGVEIISQPMRDPKQLYRS